MPLWTEYENYWDQHARRVGAYKAVTHMNPDEYYAFYHPIFLQLGIKEPKDIIDLGCGPGLLVPLIRELYPKAIYYGLDISREMIEAARHNWPDAYFWQMQNSNLPFHADLIICHSVLTHISPDDARHYLREICAYLNPGGRASISIHPNELKPYYGNIGRIDYHPAYFESMLAEAGLEIVAVQDGDLPQGAQRYYAVKRAADEL